MLYIDVKLALHCDSLEGTPMNDKRSVHDVSQWPKLDMLTWGTVGSKSPAERRFILRSCIGLSIVLLCVVAAVALRRVHVGPLSTAKAIAFLPGFLIAYVAWEWRRYISSLDELARRMQFEAAAWTYVTGLVAAMWLGALAVVIGWPHGSKALISVPFFLFVFLEPVRAAYLYLLSRRY
jgi:hypothetical protein